MNRQVWHYAHTQSASPFKKKTSENLVLKMGLSVAREEIDIGRPSRAFPVTPPGIRVRTTAVRLVKLSRVSLTKQVPTH
jgi:hypothetical protein